jgi:radical SAM protein with 4Fe4S-binding SPASM domain
MPTRTIAHKGQASSCYFRTTMDDGTRKALVQIDERCNLHCAHCFVSATNVGQSMAYGDITSLLIPRLVACRVERVTLTGGEPTIHPRFMDIVRAMRDAGMQVGFCTNATTLTDEQISELAGIGGVHANVSLDGFRPESHGRFRGDRGSFARTVTTTRKLAAAGLLQGLLCTPNTLADDLEYRELCEFAAENKAAYVLMNPLSSMGHGVRSRNKLASPEEHMRHIFTLTEPFASPHLDIVHIRFPNAGAQPLAGCEAGTIIYVFTSGEVTVCPYLVFAARTPQSQHTTQEFIVGNIFADPDIATRLDSYRFTERYEMGANPSCRSCGIAGRCGKGCPAAVIASGERIGAVDAEMCPVTTGQRGLLPLAPA